MATSASPLPLPAKVDPTPLELMMQAAANATGSSRPEVTAAAAQSSQTVADAATNAQAINQYANASQVADNLRTQSIPNQQDAWNSFSPQIQAQLHASGYRPPHKPGFFGNVLHALEGHPMSAFTAIGQGFHDTVGKVVGSQPVGDVLNAAGSPLRFVQHGIRTLQDLADAAQRSQGDTSMASVTKGNDFGKGMAEWGHLFASLASPHDWSRAWHETNSGQHYILPEVERQVITKFGPDTYHLALRVATGTTQAQIVQQAQKDDPTGKLAQQMAQTMAGKDFGNAVNLLNAGHLSIGRMAVGPDFIARHPAVGNTLSGALDGVVDWYGDPTVIGGKALGSARAARYVVNSADDVNNLYQRSAAVQRGFQDIASQVANGNVDGLLSRYRSLGSAATGLMQAKADTADKVRQYFADQLSTKALLEGNPVVASQGFGQSLPYLSRIGQARLAAKGTLQQAIDYAADKPATVKGIQPGDTIDNPLLPDGLKDKITVGAGRLARRALTLVPQDTVFNPNDPHALENLRDIALMFLPRGNVNNVLKEFATEPDLGKKWQIYRSLMLSLGKTAGLDADPEAWKAFVGKYASTEGRVYAPKGQDIIRVNGQDIHAGILKGDMNSGWLIPSFKDLYTAGKKIGVTQAVTRGLNGDHLDSWMGKWRSLTLARPAFAGRAAGEEAFRYAMANGPATYLKAQAGRMFMKGELRAKAAQDAIDSNVPLADAEKAAGVTEPLAPTLDHVAAQTAGQTWNRLAGHLPLKVQNGIKTLGDLTREYVVDQTRRAMAGTGKALADKSYQEAVQELINRGAMDRGGAFDKHLGAMHGWDPGQMAGDLDGATFNDLKVKINGKLVPAEISKTGDYKAYKPADDHYLHMWYRQLAQIANDDWGREALLWRRPFAERVSSVADKLQADPQWKNSIRSVQTRSGALVHSGEVTDRAAAEDHAQTIVKLVDSAIRSRKDFKPIPGLADQMLKTGKPPSLAALNEVKLEDLPAHVRGPEVVPAIHDTGMVHKYSDWMFSKIIGPQMNWISRQPITIHNYAQARQELRGFANTLRKGGVQEDHIANMVHDAAFQRAIDKTLPYVHNPHLRSQLSTITRNLAPFWFAQEQFYKRWGRTMVESPAAFRKAQLTMMAVKHSGFVHTDPENNQQYFVYPGSALVQKTLATALSHFGIDARVPVAGGLVGQVNMLNPGLERLGLPSWGPMVTVSLNGLKTLDPNMTSAVNAIEGKVASSSGFIKAVFPSTIVRAIDALDPGAISTEQYSSAQMGAIQALEATGHGIGEPATTQVAGMDIPNPKPGDYTTANGVQYVYQADGHWRDNAEVQQVYLNRIKNWTRILFATRLLFGMSMPASPELQFNPGNLNQEYKQLISELGPTEGATTFLALHPDATAETIGQTQNNTGGPLPATKAGMAFLDNNKALVDGFNLAAPYFIPQPDTKGNFDLSAYQEQLANGMRQRKDPKSFWKEIVYQESASQYFKMDNLRNQMISQNPGMRRKIDADWTQWSERFMAANPIFAQQYSTQGATARMQIMTQVGNALRSGAAPQNAQTAALGTLYNTWQAWKGMTGNFGNPNQPPISSAQARTLNEEFADWLGRFVQANPGVKPLVDRTIRPDLTQTLTAMAANGTAVTI